MSARSVIARLSHGRDTSIRVDASQPARGKEQLVGLSEGHSGPFWRPQLPVKFPGELPRLKQFQCGTIHEFITRYESLCTPGAWPEESWASTFLVGLNGSLRNQVRRTATHKFPTRQSLRTGRTPSSRTGFCGLKASYPQMLIISQRQHGYKNTWKELRDSFIQRSPQDQTSRLELCYRNSNVRGCVRRTSRPKLCYMEYVYSVCEEPLIQGQKTSRILRTEIMCYIREVEPQGHHADLGRLCSCMETYKQMIQRLGTFVVEGGSR